CAFPEWSARKSAESSAQAGRRSRERLLLAHLSDRRRCPESLATAPRSELTISSCLTVSSSPPATETPEPKSTSRCFAALKAPSLIRSLLFNLTERTCGLSWHKRPRGETYGS